MNKEDKVIFSKFNRIKHALNQSGLDSLLPYIVDMLSFPEMQNLLKELPINITFRSKEMLSDEGAEYETAGKGKNAVINLNKNWIKTRPKKLSVFLLHEMRHHVQLTQQQNVPLASVSEYMFLELLQEAEARIQDLSLMAQLKLKNPAKYEFDADGVKTLPLKAYLHYLKTKAKGDIEKTNAYFFELFLMGKGAGQPWHEVYQEQIIKSVYYFEPRKGKINSSIYKNVCKRYASRFHMTADRLGEIFTAQGFEREKKSKVLMIKDLKER